MVDRIAAGAALARSRGAGKHTPFDALCVSAKQLSLRMSDQAVPTRIFEEIERARDAAIGQLRELGDFDYDATYTNANAARCALVGTAATVLVYRQSIHARAAFAAAADLYTEQTR